MPLIIYISERKITQRQEAALYMRVCTFLNDVGRNLYLETIEWGMFIDETIVSNNSLIILILNKQESLNIFGQVGIVSCFCIECGFFFFIEFRNNKLQMI